MRKQALLIAALITSLLLLNGCFGQEEDQAPLTSADDSQVQPAASTLVTSDINEGYEKYKVIIDKDEFNVNDCNTLEIEKFTNKCLAKAYTNLAAKELDVKICENIVLSEEKQDCIDYLIEINQVQ